MSTPPSTAPVPPRAPAWGNPDDAEANPAPSAPSLGGSAPNGTPLGRIVLGVFLGLMAWSAVMLVAVVLPMFLLIEGADRMIDDERDRILSRVEETPLGSPNTGLSPTCRTAIDAGDLDNLEAACQNESLADIEEYGNSLG